LNRGNSAFFAWAASHLTAGVLALQVGPATTQLTMFDSCQHLTPDVRVRWTVRNDAVEFGLEGLVDPGTAMSFGHNDPVRASSA
jgi:hypothetical protein